VRTAGHDPGSCPRVISRRREALEGDEEKPDAPDAESSLPGKETIISAEESALLGKAATIPVKKSILSEKEDMISQKEAMIPGKEAILSERESIILVEESIFSGRMSPVLETSSAADQRPCNGGRTPSVITSTRSDHRKGAVGLTAHERLASASRFAPAGSPVVPERIVCAAPYFTFAFAFASAISAARKAVASAISE
jgi:hypothetical protein